MIVGATICVVADDTKSLPNQGPVSEIPDAPLVDAGKHVKGHNNYEEGKSTWPEGETGVKQTQEAWKNGVPEKNNPNIRRGYSSDGRKVRVHDGKRGIHGYPIAETK